MEIEKLENSNVIAIIFIDHGTVFKGVITSIKGKNVMKAHKKIMLGNQRNHFFLIAILQTPT